jgi:3-hydroxyisobutyrate dehydrogenase-like beta-hydroxyacid dehydrogenase
MARIGWIGLGRMGEPMARNLAAAGHALTVWNRSAGKAGRLVDAGAKVAATAAGAAKGNEVVFAILSDDTSLRHILLGQGGAIGAMDKGAVLVEMSTVSPAVSGEVAAACAARGVGYVRSPVSGSVAFAEAAKLTVLASGPSADYARVLPLLRHLSAKQFHVGTACEARVLKLALNMMVGVTAAMMGEALALGAKNGLSRDTMLDVITASAVASPLVGYKADMLRRLDYAPAFTASMMAKDFDLILGAAHASSTPMPLAAQVRQGWSALVAQGDGEEDFFKYVELAARMAGEDGR